MSVLESILARFGYVRIPNLEVRLQTLSSNLKLSTERLSKAVQNNKQKPKP
jgi:hypothetical protein